MWCLFRYPGIFPCPFVLSYALSLPLYRIPLNSYQFHVSLKSLFPQWGRKTTSIAFMFLPISFFLLFLFLFLPPATAQNKVLLGKIAGNSNRGTFLLLHLGPTSPSLHPKKFLQLQQGGCSFLFHITKEGSGVKKMLSRLSLEISDNFKR